MEEEKHQVTQAWSLMDYSFRYAQRVHRLVQYSYDSTLQNYRSAYHQRQGQKEDIDEAQERFAADFESQHVFQVSDEIVESWKYKRNTQGIST